MTPMPEHTRPKTCAAHHNLAKGVGYRLTGNYLEQQGCASQSKTSSKYRT